MKKLAISQFIILFIGTIFAWANFGYEFVRWRRLGACPACVLGDITNPFLSPCFFGAIFFTAALILGCLIMKNEKNRE